jgi:hypothetical protein
MSSRAIRSTIRIAVIIYVLAGLSATTLWASVGGSISGIVKDPSGSVVAKAHVIVKETIPDSPTRRTQTITVTTLSRFCP